MGRVHSFTLYEDLGVYLRSRPRDAVQKPVRHHALSGPLRLTLDHGGVEVVPCAWLLHVCPGALNLIVVTVLAKRRGRFEARLHII
jgi:hypothetical protein